MVALALASLALFEIPKLSVPAQPGVPYPKIAFPNGTPLDMSPADVNAIAKGFVAKPKAKLFARVTPASLTSDHATVTDASMEGFQGSRAFFPSRTWVQGVGPGVTVVLSDLKAKGHYVAVFHVTTFGGTVRFESLGASADIPVGEGDVNLPIAFVPTAKKDYVRLAVGPPPKEGDVQRLTIYAIDVYAID